MLSEEMSGRGKWLEWEGLFVSSPEEDCFLYCVKGLRGGRGRSRLRLSYKEDQPRPTYLAPLAYHLPTQPSCTLPCMLT